MKDINILIEVADGMVPGEYYNVELPSEGSVGGFWIPVDKFRLVAPYLAAFIIAIVAVSTALAYIKNRRKLQYC